MDKMAMRGLGTRILAALVTFLIGLLMSWFARDSLGHRGVTAPAATRREASSEIKRSESDSTVRCEQNDPYETVLNIVALEYHPARLVRSIDFANFRYPDAEEGFRLQNGSFGTSSDGFTLEEVAYGDVTGDGREEAMVFLDEESDGSGAFSRAYVFALGKGHRPQVIWAFQGGDRAAGGLVRLYSRNGELVVELFGKGTCIGGNMEDKDFNGLAGPKWITRTHYRWEGNTFKPSGDMEIIANPAAESHCPTCYPRSAPRSFAHSPRNEAKR